MALSAGVIQFAGLPGPATGRLFTGGQLRDPERRQRSGFSPQERPPWVGSGSPADAPRSSPRHTRRKKLSEELTDFVPNSPFYDTAPLSAALSGL